jgi:uncharacterized protein (DUF58 family)
LSPAAEAKARPPHRPGPGPTPAAVLRALDLRVGRRVHGLVPGDHRTPNIGPGTELAQVRPYEPGDDVRQIDWNATARTHEPHVRVNVAERALTTWIVLDVSASMTFGTADRRKADVAEGAALAVGHVASRRGNRLGLFSFGAGEERIHPPRQGRLGLVRLLATLRDEPDETPATGATALGEVLARTAALARQRGLIVVISDFRGPRDWAHPMRALAARHGVLAVEIRDPRESELPAVGHLALIDPETGERLEVDTHSPKLRARFAEAEAEGRKEVAGDIRHALAEHIVLTTDGDWLRSLGGRLK